MNIVIVGAGQVGYTLAEKLTAYGHDITVIDDSSENLQHIANNLDVITQEGNGASYDVQEEVGMSEADLLIAVTNSDEVNMICCLVARRLGARSTIARVRDPQYRRQMDFLRDDLGLSLAINPEQAAADEISRILRFPAAIKVETFAKDRAELVELRLGNSSPLNNVMLRNLSSVCQARVLVCSVQRGSETLIPGGDFILQQGDKLSIVASPQDTVRFSQTAGCQQTNVRNVMIIGGSRIALYLAQHLLSTGIRVRIVECNKERCEELSILLPKAFIIHGDGDSPDLLQEEGINDCDAFLTLTDSDKTNALIAMYAQSQHVAKVIAKVSNEHYATLLENIGVDSVVMPKKITSQHILQYVLAMQNSAGSNIETLYHIAEGQVEALEFCATAGAKCLNTQLMLLQLRSGVLVAAIIRNGTCIIPSGKDEIRANDSVIIVSSRHKLRDLDDILA